MKLAGWVLALGLVGCTAKDTPPAAPPPTRTVASGATRSVANPEQAATEAYAAKDYTRCAELFTAVAKPEARWAKVIAETEANIATFEATLREPALRREILALRDEDQAARQLIVAGRKDPAALAKVEASDQKTTARMKEIIAEHGWPGKTLVGQDGAKAAWLLVQHADKDLAFQKQCLALIEDAAAAGEASATEHAYLYDRVAVAEKRPQRFGTQFAEDRPQPIEDEAHVDERRLAIGLGTMASYAKDMERMYGKRYSPTTK